jgi:[acyl-carrier-protein] S-malonyltransferase
VRRAAVVFPGGGSYTSASLGSLPREHPLVRQMEELRATYGLPPLLELDGADRFDPQLHLLPEHASPLIFLISLLGGASVPRDAEVVVALGSSLGWYTALAASGALSFVDGFRLVQEIGILQKEQGLAAEGGQVLYPLTGPDWRPDPELAASVRTALTKGNGEVHRSIDLGAYEVLAGTEEGVARLMHALPQRRVGERAYPLRLALQAPIHTPLVAEVARLARQRLTDLEWRTPEVTLIDGRGARWTPWSTDRAALPDYTLGEQLTQPYQFATSLRVALREWAPDLILLPGPGNTLGSICGQALVAEGYRGVRSRGDFEAAQRSEPLILSMRR